MSQPSPAADHRVFTNTFSNWQQSLPPLLDAAKLGERLAGEQRILIKPNLVEALQPPITTPAGLVAALIDYIRAATPDALIMIGEGCGALDYDTLHVFTVLGYSDLARRRNIKLVDLNQADLVHCHRDDCRRWPEMHLPELVFDSFVLSVPVLKAHSLAGVTLTMKNMMGIAPPAYYQQGGLWGKASFHDRIQEAILDLNRYRTPDFTVLDATVGMAEAHLWGPTCKPPPHRLAAGFDPVAIDAYGAGLLKKDWRAIGHISQAHQELGIAEPLEIVQTG